MKHIQIFESYTDLDFEIPTSFQANDTFDPDKAKDASKEASDKRGGRSSDDKGLNFPAIREVYGSDAYNIRFYIAQALHVLGYCLFPYNKYFPLDKQTARDLSMGTYYIGEPWQNEIMKKLSPKLLKSIAPWVEKIMLYPDKFLSMETDLQRTTKSPGVSRESRAIFPLIGQVVADSELELISGNGSIPAYLKTYIERKK